MNNEDSRLQLHEGPPVYDNWLALLGGKPTLAVFEFPLLSDARVIGEISEGFGPYQFINPVPITARPGLVRAVIILRAKLCIEFSTPDMTKTNSDRYHGGSFNDEIAALSSLALGIRLKAGGVTRRFEPNGDRFGRPVAYDVLPEPVVIIGSYGLLLPSVVDTHSLIDLKPLSLLPILTIDDAIALVRAARLYQDALWIGESEPSLSWLMLVSSLETAANHWSKIDDSPIERLRNFKPDLIELLEESCEEGISTQVAEFIAESIGSTKKFVDFVITFLPPKPSSRPPEFIQLSWDPQEMKKSMRIIYGYRSKALHDGRPFPAPMCDPPFRHLDWEAPAEKPFGMAASSKGGTWLSKDTPMLLHTFEYIVRNSLLNWWRSMIPTIQE